ncbi:MAG: hypothetical protein JWM80_2524 [Cyanobacteria bacterium RYN_339]|nr:hypothetical protein [Cyanobacteria bacterium RYN_339]
MASELDTYDPEKLAAAMANLKTAIGTLRRQVRLAQGSGPVKPVAPKPEARAAIREKARTGTLKPVRQHAPAAATGMVGPRATGRVKLTEPQPPLEASAELEAVEGWVSLSDLAAQNEAKRQPRRKN